MKTARILVLAGAALVLRLPAGAQAIQETLRGRTGLPTVRKGGGNVWVEKGSVDIAMKGTSVTVWQDFRLRYPGPPLEKGPQRIQVAVREDYFRSRNGGPEVTNREAKGFNFFQVRVDGKKVQTSIEPWEINSRKDTATRWRVWNLTFKPGQIRRMRMTSSAPLGRRGSRPYLMFISKDLGGWRDKPNVVEIRFTAPGALETRLDGVEPRPNDINSRAVRWVYRKTSPKRDVFVLLPPGR